MPNHGELLSRAGARDDSERGSGRIQSQNRLGQPQLVPDLGHLLVGAPRLSNTTRCLIGRERGSGAVPKLLIVGRRGWQADDVFAQLDIGDFGDRVVEVGALDDRRLADILTNAWALPDILTNAWALLFPSFAEGYGIPLVEALAAGVPVIASDLPVFREIGQGVPELLPPYDLDAWRDAVLEYLHPKSSRRAAQMARRQAFRVPDWRDHFERVDKLLENLGS